MPITAPTVAPPTETATVTTPSSVSPVPPTENRHGGPSTSPSNCCHSRCPAKSIRIKALQPLSLVSPLSLIAMTTSLRWIQAKGSTSG